MRGFKNANVYVEGLGITKTDVAVTNGLISQIGSNLNIENPFEIGNGLVLPGFVDEHIHGAAGYDAMDGSEEAISEIAKAVAKEGTTSFLATTMTQSPQNIAKALSAVGSYIKRDPKIGARVLGVHLEGPFISPKFAGAQPLEFIVKPQIEKFKEYQAISNNTIKIVTLAPEEDGATELIQFLNKNNIVASLGHSSAGYNIIETAIDAGLKSITHTYNAQTPLHHREVGAVGSAMLFDSLNCELICDAIHVCPPAMQLLVKNKPHDKITLITDAMRAKSLPDGDSELGGQRVIVKDGEARLADGTLAGSVLKMNIAVYNMVNKVGIDLCDAVDFATINPSKNLGISDTVGSIRLGKKADFTVIDSKFDVILTVRDGNIIYSR